MADLRERLGGSNGDIRAIVEDSCALLVWSLTNFFYNFRAGLNESVNEAFPAGCISSHFNTDTAIDGFNLCSSEAAVSEDGEE